MNITESIVDYDIKKIDFEDFFHCPGEYQFYVKRLMSIHAYSEVSGARDVAVHLGTAPNYQLRETVARIVYQETTHARLIYKILEKIHVNEQHSLAIVNGDISGYRKTQSLEGILAVADQENTWVDMILNHMLVERAGSYMIGNYCKSSFKPWAEVSEKIYEEEKWHINFGLKQFEFEIENNGVAEFTPVFSKWYARALNFFGPPNNKSEKILKNYGLKRKSNEELRQSFILEIEEIIGSMNLLYLIENKISQNYPFKVIA